MRLIDADILELEGWKLHRLYRQDKDTMVYESKPLADIKTVQPTGRWILDDEGYHCSECWYHAYGNTAECFDGTYKFCPNCGAKMGEQE